MGKLERQGIECLPLDLLQAKERLRFDSEKLQFTDVTQENAEGNDPHRLQRGEGALAPPDGGAVAPPDGHHTDDPDAHGKLSEPHALPLRPDVQSNDQDANGKTSEPHALPSGPDVYIDDQDADGKQSEPHALPPGPDIQPDDQDADGKQSEPHALPSGSHVEIDSEVAHRPPLGPSSSAAAGPQEVSSSSSSSTSSSSSSSSGSPKQRPSKIPRPAEWPPKQELMKWARIDNNARRFRTSTALGPLWSDVVQRITVDNATGRVICMEEFDGKETTQKLHRALPEHVKSIRTTLIYRKVDGHPQPGVKYEAPDPEPMDDGGSDERLLRRIKRSLDDEHSGATLPQPRRDPPKSRVFGVWVADVKTPWGDRARYPVIANSRDLQLFHKVLHHDTLYTYSEIHGSWICLTKGSGKELNERLLNEEEKRMFDEAKILEIENLEGGNAIEFVTDKEEIARVLRDLPHRIMPSRFILTKKMKEINQTWKAKARWILLGHKDPDVLKPERYSPTPSTTTVYMTFQVIASLGYRLVIMDVSSAFGQSDPEERADGPLYATMPPSGIPKKEAWYLIRVRTAVYGLCNAPSSWRRTVQKALISLEYRESSFDPCLYYLPYTPEEVEGKDSRGCAGVVLLDVDDFIQGGNQRHQEKMEVLRLRFRFGKWRDLYEEKFGEYLGRTVRQLSNYEVQVDMGYIEEKLRPVVLSRDRLKDDQALLTEKEISLLRGVGGSLLWVGREARPDMGAVCAMAMSWDKSGPRIANIKQANKAVKELQATKGLALRILPIALNDGFWISFSDASVANVGERSQGGFIIAFADKKLLDGQVGALSLNSWRSHRVRRAVKASLGSEALAMDDALAELEWLRAMYCEVCVPNTSIADGTRFSNDVSVAVVRQKDGDNSILVTDARALYDLFHRRSGAAGLCRRAQIDVAVMCKSASLLNASVYWVPGQYMLADPLTKKTGNSRLLRGVMILGQYAVQEGPLQQLIATLPDVPPDGCVTLYLYAR